MSTFDNTDSHDDQVIDVFSDPVAYLAAHGIDASLIADTTLPAAA
ncbi:MAG TPA: hypothetical protein VFP42_06855 [Acidimicrobiia bacterium]|nr:hypothetical protein [Acidimicrobiia bacterium]